MECGLRHCRIFSVYRVTIARGLFSTHAVSTLSTLLLSLHSASRASHDEPSTLSNLKHGIRQDGKNDRTEIEAPLSQ